MHDHDDDSSLDEYERAYPPSTDNLIARFLHYRAEEDAAHSEFTRLRAERHTVESSLFDRLAPALESAGGYDGVRVGELALIPIAAAEPIARRIDIIKLLTPDELARELGDPRPAR